jgi:hypothetical protein
MKFQIRKGQNSIDGSDMFYVYREDGANEWGYVSGFGTEKDARACVHRKLHPIDDVVIAEIEG